MNIFCPSHVLIKYTFYHIFNVYQIHVLFLFNCVKTFHLNNDLAFFSPIPEENMLIAQVT